MPYTPPSHRSPASSAPTSPDASRRPSLATGGSRPSLPRSASYLTRHRRTPSAGAQQYGHPTYQPTPQATSEDLKSMLSNSSSVRKSPPPVTDDRGMPNGAIISPPESQASSDDDDLPEVRSRRLDSIKQLHAAISQIPQHRESSPEKTRSHDHDAGPAIKLLIPSPPQPNEADGEGRGMHHSFSTGSLGPLASSGRKISHNRSATDSDLLVTKSADTSLTGSDADSEEEVMMMRKPQMVRKKSGELVRPALRPASRRRPSSMPGTPTFSKAVHFDSHLEHVRHFLQVDRPLAVSAGSSPADNYNSDNEYPFPGNEDPKGTRSPPFEWDITITNFPVETPARKSLVVRLERVWLSPDRKCLIGSVDVANLAFHKAVVCRFTLDYWKTTSEVTAEYSAEIRPKMGPIGRDRFNFTIKLSEVANLESKTLYFCIRYSVNGQEHWDNNNGTNFQVDFKKKMLPHNGKRNFQGASARPAGELPRSNRRANPLAAPRPKSMPGAVGLNGGASEFGETAQPSLNFDQSIHEYLGEPDPTLRLKTTKSLASLPSDNLTGRLAPPSGQAFANRYDFGASLSTAIQAAKNAMPKSMASGGNDGLYMKMHTKGSTSAKQAPPPGQAPDEASATVEEKSTTASKPVPSSTNGNVANTAKSLASKDPAATNQTSTAANKQSVPAIPGTASSGSATTLSSASYEELVSKYCFFGSKQNSPQLKDGTMRSGRFDGPDDEAAARAGSNSNSSDSSLTGSPLQMSALNRNYPQHIHGAMHHTLRSPDPNPYFQHATLTGLAAPSSPRSPLLHNALMEQQQRAAFPPNSTAGARSAPLTPSQQHLASASGAASSGPQGMARAQSPTVVAFHHQRSVTGPSSADYQYQQHQHRFPFGIGGNEAHASPAIRG